MSLRNFSMYQKVHTPLLQRDQRWYPHRHENFNCNLTSVVSLWPSKRQEFSSSSIKVIISLLISCAFQFQSNCITELSGGGGDPFCYTSSVSSLKLSWYLSAVFVIQSGSGINVQRLKTKHNNLKPSSHKSNEWHVRRSSANSIKRGNWRW